MSRLILASGSPRRRALLGSLGVEFDIITSDAEERNAGGAPWEIVERNAAAKRDDVSSRVTGDVIVVAADTLVFESEHVLPKPTDRADAIRMLRHLSGKTHQVCTGLALSNLTTGQRVTGTETTDVTFRALSEDEITRFVDIVNPLDRAGAYTVDGPGTLLVAGYRGCYQNVLGLPMVKLDILLRGMGYDLFQHLSKERAKFL